MIGRIETRKFDGRTWVVIDGPGLSNKQERAIVRTGCVQLDSEGSLTTLAGLKHMGPHIKHLLVTDLGITDLSALSSMSELESLGLFCGTLKRDVDFSMLNRLTDFSGRWQPALTGLFDIRSLNVLMLERPNIDCWTSLTEMTSLLSVDFRSGAAAPRELALPQELRALRVAATRTFDVSCALPAKRNLARIDLQQITQLKRIDRLTEFSGLRELFIEDGGQVALPSAIYGQVPRVVLIGTSRPS